MKVCTNLKRKKKKILKTYFYSQVFTRHETLLVLFLFFFLLFISVLVFLSYLFYFFLLYCFETIFFIRVLRALFVVMVRKEKKIQIKIAILSISLSNESGVDVVAPSFLRLRL